MSETLAVSVTNPPPSVAGSWIKANALAALINAAMGLIALLLSYAFGAHNPDASSFGKVIVFLGYFLASGLGFAAFATLNGRVLREKIPAFPLRTWIIAHLVVGLLLGLYAGHSALQPLQMNPDRPLDMSYVWIGWLIVAVPGSVVVALVLGGFQAFLMRNVVAQGFGAWISFWMLAGVLCVFVYGLVLFVGNPFTSIASAIMTQGVGFLAAIVITIVMLPAVAWLTPRQHAG